MKRISALMLCFLLIFLGGCKTKEQNPAVLPQNTEREMVGVWISFSEIKEMCLSAEGFASAFKKATEDCKNIGINTIFLHVRPFCDSIYKSEYFPLAEYAEASGGDILKIAIEIAEGADISVHAWINPYRVSTSTTDINALPDGSPARKWRNDEKEDNDDNVCITENGIYLNPAKNEVKRLILDGVREILDNYSVGGIHMDDYFYPTTDAAFDFQAYENYKTSVSMPLELGDWRRKNVNGLLNSVYCAVKAKSSDLVFGVSPAADIERCYNTLYADVKGWIGGGYIDYIMPQLYFGFEYPKEEFRFHNLLESWGQLTENSFVKFYCGLSYYKVGTENEPDKAEWNNYDDILSRQILLLRENGADGFVFFSYSSLVSENQLNKTQLTKIMEII